MQLSAKDNFMRHDNWHYLQVYFSEYKTSMETSTSEHHKPSVGKNLWSLVHVQGTQTSVEDTQTYVPFFSRSLSPKSTCRGFRVHSTVAQPCHLAVSGNSFLLLAIWHQERAYLRTLPFVTVLVSLACAQGPQKARERL